MTRGHKEVFSSRKISNGVVLKVKYGSRIYDMIILINGASQIHDRAQKLLRNVR